MKQLEEIIFESNGCQGKMEEYIADICFELNKLTANNDTVYIDDLVSKLVLLIEHCDMVLKDNELSKEKLNSSINESAILESKLLLEKKQRELDLNKSFHSQEEGKNTELILMNKIKF